MESSPRNLTIDKATSQRLYGLRGIAILLILWDHYNPDTMPVHLGPAAVRLFFVLSGFHITLSFWKEREGRTGGWFQSLRKFYLKRFFRIAPLFYSGLILGALSNMPQARETLGWDCFFLTNFYVVHAGDWPISTAHFWSLAMQEQFYLLWPLLLLIVWRWSFNAIVILSVACSVFFRFYCDSHGLSPYCKWLLLPGCWDSFMAGAIVAHIYAHGARWSAAARPFLRPALWLSLPFFVALAIFFLPRLESMQFLCESLEAVSLAGLVWATFNVGSRNLHSRVVENRWLIHIGKISYYLYVFQAFFYYWIGSKIIRHFGDDFTVLDATLVFMFLTLLSIVVLSSLARAAQFVPRSVTFWRKAKRVDPENQPLKEGTV